MQLHYRCKQFMYRKYEFDDSGSIFVTSTPQKELFNSTRQLLNLLSKKICDLFIAQSKLRSLYYKITQLVDDKMPQHISVYIII